MIARYKVTNRIYGGRGHLIVSPMKRVSPYFDLALGCASWGNKTNNLHDDDDDDDDLFNVLSVLLRH